MLKAETLVDITDFHKNVITVPKHEFICKHWHLIRSEH